MAFFKKIAKRVAEQAKKNETEGEAPAKRRGFAFKVMKPSAQPQEEAPTGPKRRGGLKGVLATVAARAAGKPVAMKKGGMADKSGRAMKRKTADTKGRAMKKGK